MDTFLFDVFIRGGETKNHERSNQNEQARVNNRPNIEQKSIQTEPKNQSKINQKWCKNRPKRVSGTPPASIWAPDASREPSKGLLDASWGALGRLLARLEALLWGLLSFWTASWAPSGAVQALPGPSGHPSRPSLGCFEHLLGHFGTAKSRWRRENENVRFTHVKPMILKVRAASQEAWEVSGRSFCATKGQFQK